MSHIRLIGEEHRFVPALAHMVGAKITEIPIQNIERPVGRVELRHRPHLRRRARHPVPLFLPVLRARGRYEFRQGGGAALAAGAAIGAVLLAINLITGEPTTRTRSGWFLLAAILVLSSLQVLLTGILAEVLARILYRTGGAAELRRAPRVERDDDHATTLSSAADVRHRRSLTRATARPSRPKRCSS